VYEREIKRDREEAERKDKHEKLQKNITEVHYREESTKTSTQSDKAKLRRRNN